MCYHTVELVAGNAEHICGNVGDVLVAGAVEAVAANTVLISQVIRNSVTPGVLGHGRVERGIEHSNLRQVWPGVEGGTHTLHVRGVMQRRKRGQRIDLVDHLLVEQHGVGKLLSTLHHAVADSLQFAAVQDVFELVSHHMQGDFVVGNISTDVFNETGGEHLLCFGGGGVTHLVFERRGTCVHNKNKHGFLVSF